MRKYMIGHFFIIADHVPFCITFIRPVYLLTVCNRNSEPPGLDLFFLIYCSFFFYHGQEALRLERLAFNCSIRSFVGEWTTFMGLNGTAFPFDFALMIFMSLSEYSS